MDEQEKLLAHGPKFVITPREALVNEYIVAVEQACTKLEQGKQEEFTVEMKRLIKQDQNNRRQAKRKQGRIQSFKRIKNGQQQVNHDQ